MNTQITVLRQRRGNDQHNQLLERIIADLKQGSSEIRGKALETAEAMGNRDSFILEEELKPKLLNICNEYRKLKSSINLGLNPRSQGHMGKLDASLFNDEIAKLKQRIDYLTTKTSLDPRQNLPKPEKLNWRERYLHWMPKVLLIGDAVWEASAFSLVVGSFLLAFPVALCLGFAKYGLLKYVAKKLKSSQGWKKKIAPLSIVIGIVALGSYGLGYLRSMFAEKTEGIEITPFAFMLLSLLFFIGALAFEWYVLARQPEIEEKKAKIQDYQKFADLKSELAELEAEAKAKEKEKGASLETKILTMDDADTFFKTLDSEYKATVTEFISVYLLYRGGRDKEIPAYFKHVEIPEVLDADDLSPLSNKGGAAYQTNNEKIENYED